jgi:hypothetical protein
MQCILVNLILSLALTLQHADGRFLPFSLPPSLTLSLGDTTASAVPALAAALKQPVKVLFDHDGGVDDFVALLMLLAEPKVDLVGITVLPADCIGEVALNTTFKILQLTGQTNIPVGLSTLTGQHEFPMQYRVEPLAVDLLPMLNGPTVAEAVLQAKAVNKQTGQELFAQLLLAQQEPITIVMTGEVLVISVMTRPLCFRLVSVLEGACKQVKQVKLSLPTSLIVHRVWDSLETRPLYWVAVTVRCQSPVVVLQTNLLHRQQSHCFILLPPLLLHSAALRPHQ